MKQGGLGFRSRSYRRASFGTRCEHVACIEQLHGVQLLVLRRRPERDKFMVRRFR